MGLDFDRVYQPGSELARQLLPEPERGEPYQDDLCAPFAETYINCLKDEHCPSAAVASEEVIASRTEQTEIACRQQGGLTESQLAWAKNPDNCYDIGAVALEFPNEEGKEETVGDVCYESVWEACKVACDGPILGPCLAIAGDNCQEWCEEQSFDIHVCALEQFMEFDDRMNCSHLRDCNGNSEGGPPR